MSTGKDNGGAQARRQVIFQPKSMREVRKYLKEPLARNSAVIYFTGKDRRPFLLGSKGGISSHAEFKLAGKWKLSSDKLGRIYIIVDEPRPEE